MRLGRLRLARLPHKETSVGFGSRFALWVTTRLPAGSKLADMSTTISGSQD
jgi:hypothetical protein